MPGRKCAIICVLERGRTGTKTISLTQRSFFLWDLSTDGCWSFHLCKHPPIHLSFPAPSPSLRDPFCKHLVQCAKHSAWYWTWQGHARHGPCSHRVDSPVGKDIQAERKLPLTCLSSLPSWILSQNHWICCIVKCSKGLVWEETISGVRDQQPYSPVSSVICGPREPPACQHTTLMSNLLPAAKTLPSGPWTIIIHSGFHLC